MLMGVGGGGLGRTRNAPTALEALEALEGLEGLEVAAEPAALPFSCV